MTGTTVFCSLLQLQELSPQPLGWVHKGLEHTTASKNMAIQGTKEPGHPRHCQSQQVLMAGIAPRRSSSTSLVFLPVRFLGNLFLKKLDGWPQHTAVPSKGKGSPFVYQKPSKKNCGWCWDKNKIMLSIKRANYKGLIKRRHCSQDVLWSTRWFPLPLPLPVLFWVKMIYSLLPCKQML